MKIETARFGLLEVPAEKVLTFEEGLPGFEKEHLFALVAEKEGGPFYWLQSLNRGDLAFVVADPCHFLPSYEFELPPQEAEKLGLQNAADLAIFTIITIPENPAEMTANLQAPVLINLKNHRGRQVILSEGSYPIRYRILEGLRQLASRSGKGKSEAAKGEELAVSAHRAAG